MTKTTPLSNEEKEQLRQWAIEHGFDRKRKGGGWLIGGLRQYYEESPELLDKHLQFFAEEQMPDIVRILIYISIMSGKNDVEIFLSRIRQSRHKKDEGNAKRNGAS